MMERYAGSAQVRHAPYPGICTDATSGAYSRSSHSAAEKITWIVRRNRGPSREKYR